MRFLIDENVFPKVSVHLQEKGHNIRNLVQAGLAGLPDDQLIQIARSEQRTLVTFDLHFGDIFRYPPEENEGIILIRIHPPLLGDITAAFDRLLNQHKDASFKGQLIVLGRTGYRVRRSKKNQQET